MCEKVAGETREGRNTEGHRAIGSRWVCHGDTDAEDRKCQEEWKNLGALGSLQGGCSVGNKDEEDPSGEESEP